MTNPQVNKSYNNLETVLKKDKPAKISGTTIKSQSTTSIFLAEGSVRHGKNPQYSK